MLTSGHFLIGDQLTSLPQPDTSDLKLSQRYNLIQRQVTSFWHAWSKGYLSQLKTRTNWHITKPNVAINQIVIMDNLVKPAYWNLAKIVAVYPDKNVVRTIEVFDGNLIKKREISAIIPLPTDE